MSEPVLDAVGVAKFLGHGAGRVHALRGVNLSLRGGELVLLMGPSGSGKTTLLSILGCLMTPTDGTIRVRGQPSQASIPRPSPGSGATTSGSSFSPIICFRP